MRFLCLSNSFKEGGRCLAGLKMDMQNQIYKSSWVRPVYNTEHEQIPNEFASEFEHFDIIEFDVDNDYSRNDYQSENIMVQGNTLKKVGMVNNPSSYLKQICENTKNKHIFGNNEKFIDENNIQKLGYSLTLLGISNFEITQGFHDYQRRLAFNFRGINYDLPITDSTFLMNYKQDKFILDGINEIYIILSLAVEFQSKYYKLIASILY